jgi:hypothetical protein
MLDYGATAVNFHLIKSYCHTHTLPGSKLDSISSLSTKDIIHMVIWLFYADYSCLTPDTSSQLTTFFCRVVQFNSLLMCLHKLFVWTEMSECKIGHETTQKGKRHEKQLVKWLRAVKRESSGIYCRFAAKFGVNSMTN